MTELYCAATDFAVTDDSATLADDKSCLAGEPGDSGGAAGLTTAPQFAHLNLAHDLWSVACVIVNCGRAAVVLNHNSSD